MDRHPAGDAAADALCAARLSAIGDDAPGPWPVAAGPRRPRDAGPGDPGAADPRDPPPLHHPDRRDPQALRFPLCRDRLPPTGVQPFRTYLPAPTHAAAPNAAA